VENVKFMNVKSVGTYSTHCPTDVKFMNIKLDGIAVTAVLLKA
jgi:hypothetical protein